MFKKLKDKIAEEVRQAPLRLPASVQHQLSQVHINTGPWYYYYYCSLKLGTQMALLVDHCVIDGDGHECKELFLTQLCAFFLLFLHVNIVFCLHS